MHYLTDGEVTLWVMSDGMQPSISSSLFTRSGLTQYSNVRENFTGGRDDCERRL